jgi:hypothetical protein
MSRHIAYRRRLRRALSILFLVALPWLAIVADAAEDCADTSQKLIQYLNKSETQATAYRIKVLAGSYVIGGAKYQWSPSASTTIEGGYLDCNIRGTNAAAATTIDASGLSHGFQLVALDNNLKLDGLTFLGGGTTSFSAGEASAGSLTLTHTRVTQTTPVLVVRNGTMTLEDVLIDHPLPDPSSHCSATIVMTDDNTVTWKFVTVETIQGEDVCFDSNGASAHHNSEKIYNSIIWPGNIRLDAGAWHAGDVSNLKLFNSLFDQVILIHGTYAEQASLHTDPLWVNPAADNFTLQVPPSPISPAINVGASAAEIPGGISASDTDIAGNPRMIGSAPDMGAYESAVDESEFFLVTNTSDCSTALNQPSCGSLRDAVARASAPTSTAPSKLIQFWIVDGTNQPVCPAIISVASGLPDVTSSVTIDGYSQGHSGQIDPPLSWPNTSPYSFNASLCVNIVGPGSGFGLRVPAGSNGSLTLRGVGLGGFAQGVMLLGGADHQIAGNQFGGVTTNGVNLHSFSTSAVNVSPAVQPSGALIVGGENVADRNVFLNALSFGGIAAQAISMGSNAVSNPDLCQIVGNFVGIAPDGASAPGNDYGMILNGDGCTLRENWIAGSHDGAMWIQGQRYIVQSNVIGLAPNSFSPQNNGGFGIRVSGSNNTIGAPASYFLPPILFDQGLGNYVADTQESGIIVAGTGTGNALRGNLIVNSGLGNGGLSLDLGDDGATANDVSDADTGANQLQNFPQLHGLSWTSPPQPGANNPATLEGTLMTQPGLYNIDVYLGEGCDVGDRGLAGLWIGRYTVSVDDASVSTGFEIPTTIPDYFDPALAAVSLTATNEVDGNTSELGTCLSIDTLFKDGMDL